MQHLDAALLSDARILAAYLIFFGSYFVFALGKFPWMRLTARGGDHRRRPDGGLPHRRGRTKPGIDRLRDHRPAVRDDGGRGESAAGGFFERLAESIVQRLHPHHLLPTVILLCGVPSAFLVNDIVCLVMTPFVLHMARRLGMPPVPYLHRRGDVLEYRQRRDDHRESAEHADRVAVGDLYLDFIARLGPIAAAGLFLNWASIYWLRLRGAGDRAGGGGGPVSRRSSGMGPCERSRSWC